MSFKTQKIYFKRGAWSEIEDQALKAAVEKYGLQSWSRIARACLQGREGDQCQLRWNEYLNPLIVKGDWQMEEKRGLIEAYNIFPGQWSTISEHLRSEGFNRRPWQCQAQYERMKKGIDGQESKFATTVGAEDVPGTISDGSSYMLFHEMKAPKGDKRDADNKEKQILAHILPRLANQAGKKKLRKEKEAQLKHTKVVADLERKRELEAANISTHTQKKKFRQALREDEMAKGKKGEGHVSSSDDSEASDSSFTPVDAKTIISNVRTDRKRRRKEDTSGGLIRERGKVDIQETPLLQQFTYPVDEGGGAQVGTGLLRGSRVDIGAIEEAVGSRNSGMPLSLAQPRRQYGRGGRGRGRGRGRQQQHRETESARNQALIRSLLKLNSVTEDGQGNPILAITDASTEETSHRFPSASAVTGRKDDEEEDMFADLAPPKVEDENSLPFEEQFNSTTKKVGEIGVMANNYDVQNEEEEDDEKDDEDEEENKQKDYYLMAEKLLKSAISRRWESREEINKTELMALRPLITRLIKSEADMDKPDGANDREFWKHLIHPKVLRLQNEKLQYNTNILASPLAVQEASCVYNSTLSTIQRIDGPQICPSMASSFYIPIDLDLQDAELLKQHKMQCNEIDEEYRKLVLAQEALCFYKIAYTREAGEAARREFKRQSRCESVINKSPDIMESIKL